MSNSTENTVSPPSPSSLHILLFPFISSGHLIPTLDLIHRLLNNIPNLTITLLITPQNLPSAQPLISAHPATSLQTLVLTPPDLPSPKAGLPDRIRVLHALCPSIISWFNSHPKPPIAIISDFFLGWTQNLASELNIPRIVFAPSGALGTSIFHSIWKYQPKNPEPENIEYEVSFEKLPGAPRYPWWQISHTYREGKEGDPDWEFFKECVLANLASWGMILNTFHELERDYLEFIKKELLGNDRVWAVGPLLPPAEDYSLANKRGGPSSIATDDLMAWLDKKPDSSLVYVCFGSRTFLTEKQTVALRDALGYCKANFIWCVRQADGKIDNILDEFQNRVGDRGLIIKGWAPQLAIIRHRSMAAFVTHCGWNSVLEAISAGVVTVAWPMGADQFADAQLLVDKLGVGLRVKCEGAENVPDSSELARLLDESLTVCGNQGVKERMRRLRRDAEDAVKQGGSSARDVDGLATQLYGLMK